MAEQKIFAGPRIRRVRRALGLTQTAMAAGLGISPSYLNLIERNQRPLTVQLILRLSAVYKIEAEELNQAAGGAMVALREVFADPLLSGELSGEQELVDIAEAAPNAAAGIAKLYRAYREQAGRLSDLSELMRREGRTMSVPAARLPVDEVRDLFERRPNHFAEIDAEAEVFAAELGAEEELSVALQRWLRQAAGTTVRVLPIATMPNSRRRYDRHSQRLFLSERLSPFDRLREIASEACLLRLRPAIEATLAALGPTSDEARRLARFELGRYAGLALMMPYAAFLSAAQRLHYDIDLLRARFGASFEQAANRLTMLARPGSGGVPFFLLEIDQAGNRLRKAGAQGFPQSRFGGACPKLAIHAAFAQPAQLIVEAVVMPDGAEFLTVCRTVEGPQGGFAERPRRTALLLGCDIAFRGELVYGAALPPQAAGASGASFATPIGPACRLCERVGCLSRAEPPLTRPLGLDEVSTGLSAFDFQ